MTVMDGRRVASELVKIAKGLVADTIRIRVPGLQRALEAVPMEKGKWVIPWENQSVKDVVDRAMASHGFGSRKRGGGKYGSDYWIKGGKAFRSTGEGGTDEIVLEQYVLPGRF
jgi:hypothetical protein